MKHKSVTRLQKTLVFQYLYWFEKNKKDRKYIEFKIITRLLKDIKKAVSYLTTSNDAIRDDFSKMKLRDPYYLYNAKNESLLGILNFTMFVLDEFDRGPVQDELHDIVIYYFHKVNEIVVYKIYDKYRPRKNADWYKDIPERMITDLRKRLRKFHTRLLDYEKEAKKLYKQGKINYDFSNFDPSSIQIEQGDYDA